MARLCIAANVKNEQFIIADWCETHRYADELLIVDTGSGDQTIGIAEQYGAHIRHADIEEGYGVVRTACINFAAELGCEWVMILDADERVFAFVPEFVAPLKSTPAPIDMTTLWPAGLGAPTDAKYEAIRTGRMIHQETIIRGAIEDPHVVAYRTCRRHWFDLNMQLPCQPFADVQHEDGSVEEGIPDFQNRFCRTDRGLRYIRRVHEWLRREDGGEPEPQGTFGPDGPAVDHFHVPSKRLTPGRSEEVTETSNRLHKLDVAEGAPR